LFYYYLVLEDYESSIAEYLKAFMDLGKTPRDNDLLTIFLTELIRTSILSFTRHVGIGSAALKALDDLFSNCLISVSVKGSNVSIMDMQNPSTNGLPYDKMLERNSLCIFNIFLTEEVIKTMSHIFI